MTVLRMKRLLCCITISGVLLTASCADGPSALALPKNVLSASKSNARTGQTATPEPAVKQPGESAENYVYSTLNFDGSLLPSQITRERNALQLPEIKVAAKQFDWFTIFTLVEADGSRRVYLKGNPEKKPGGLFLAGARINDEIVSINGRDITTYERSDWLKDLSDVTPILVRRRVALGKYELVQIECRRDMPVWRTKPGF